MYLVFDHRSWHIAPKTLELYYKEPQGRLLLSYLDFFLALPEVASEHKCEMGLFCY